MIWLLVAQGVVGALWTFLMFRTLLRLRARTVSRTGQPFPGSKATLAEFAAFLRAPDYASDRRQLRAVTVVMVLLILGFALLQP